MIRIKQAQGKDMEDNGFSIQFVANITGINGHTLRAWEKRYQAVVPERNGKGKRLYSQENIEKLKLLGNLVQLGNSISDIANLSIEDLNNLLLKYGERNQTSSKEIVDIDVNVVLKNLIMGLNGFKLDIISHELEKIKNQMNPREFALKILIPLLREIGELVDNNFLTIAQEHAMSAIVKFHVGHMIYQEFSRNKNKAKTIVIATPEGELHEFGIMISALLCSHYNINFIYLGPNMPALALSEASNQVNADIVLVGVSKAFQMQNTEHIENYFLNLRESLDKETDLWIGGFSKVLKFLDQEHVSLLPTLNLLDQNLADLLK